MRRFFWLAVFSVLSTWFSAAKAEEAITSFDSNIVINFDGSIAITETIAVQAEQNRMRHGIFRDLPTYVRNNQGELQDINFEIISIKRDGAEENYTTSSIERGKRLQIGSKDIELQRGRHVYEIQYRINRVIRYFTDYDEFAWNVTGNTSFFPIESASAIITLPSGVQIPDTAFSTGVFGNVEKNATASVQGNVATFRTTQTLSPREGLTVAVKIPKTALRQPQPEAIERFHSVLDLAEDGSLTVTENITLNAEGDLIQNGLTRILPFYFTDNQGRRREYDYQIISVKRDGQDEDYDVYAGKAGFQITTSSSKPLSYGQHTYELVYRADRHIRFLSDHDDLQWSLTGHQWPFPVKNADAELRLPDGVGSSRGRYQATASGGDQSAVRVFAQDNRIQIAANQPLSPGQELALHAQFPKDILSALDEDKWFYSDNRDYFIGFAGLIIVFLYYFRAWSKVGRDPPRSVVVPRWDVPEDLSPALVNYIDNEGFSGSGWTALSATILNLAVRQFIRLENKEDGLIIHRLKNPKTAGKLQAGDIAVLNWFGKTGEFFEITKENGYSVKAMSADFQSAIEKEHRGRYYNANFRYILWGGIISLLSFLILAIFGSIDAITSGRIFVLSCIASFTAIGFAKLVKTWYRSKSLKKKILTVIWVGLLCFVGITAALMLISVVILDLITIKEAPLLLAVGGLIFQNILYVFLMGAPTPLGAKRMAEIDGLRQYLSLAEQDRMNMADAPLMTPKHFETLLPYAVALGVEKQWSKLFEARLDAAAAAALSVATVNYEPTWFNDNFAEKTAEHSHNNMGDLSSSIARQMESSMPEPSSSSQSSFSSGGNFSGSGAGGGGVGGW